jgi:predicted outer membrane repeat protein
VKHIRIISLVLVFTLSLTAEVWQVPDSVSTIQAAVDTAAAGDTVLVMRAYANASRVHIDGKRIVLLANNYIKNPGAYNFSTGAAIFDSDNGPPLLFIENADSCVIRGFLFDRPDGMNGGGIRIRDSRGLLFDGVHFRANTLRLDASSLQLSNAHMYDLDQADSVLVRIEDSRLRLRNNLYYSLRADGLFSLRNAELMAENLAVFDNTAAFFAHVENSAADLDFCTLLDSAFTADPWSLTGGGSVDIRNSIVEHPLPEISGFMVNYSALRSAHGGTGNISADPRIDTENPFPVLLSDSPCISAADPDTSGIPRRDLAGDPRPFPEWAPPDMGAFESERHVKEHTGDRFWVDPGGDDIWGNGSKAMPLASVQAAVDIAGERDSVILRPGNYRGSVNIAEKNIVLASAYALSGDTSAAENTVLLADTSGDRPVITVRDCDSLAVLGLSLREGAGRLFYPNYSFGGGIYCEQSTLYLERVLLENNSAAFCGGGVYALNSTLRLDHVILNNNRAHLGGALGISGSILKGAYVTVSNNSAGNGGGLYGEDLSRIVLYYSAFSDNSALKYSAAVPAKPATVSEYGGAVYVYNADLRIYTTLFSGNRAGNAGAAVFACRGDINILQSTLADNHCNADSAGILHFASQTGPVSLVNCIVWNPEEIQIVASDSELELSHNDLAGGTAAVLLSGDTPVIASGNIDADPLFDSGYVPGSGSAVADAGVSAYTKGGYYLFRYGPGDYGGNAPDPGYRGASPEIVFDLRIPASGIAVSGPETPSLRAFPNPFNPDTRLEITLPAAGRVSLDIYDICGRKIRTLLDHPLPAGVYRLEFRGGDLPSGIYFCRLGVSGTTIANTKLLLLK